MPKPRLGRRSGEGICYTCGWRTDGSNAVGNAAQHAKRCPDHAVHATISQVFCWGPRAEDRRTSNA